MSEVERVTRENQLLKKTLADLGRKNAELESSLGRLRESLPVDEETSFYTEEFFWRRLDEELHRAQRHRQFVSLLLINAEDYTQEIPFLASSLKSSLRDIDLLSRLRNNYIAVALLETGDSDVHHVVRRLRENIKEGDRVPIAVASYPTDADGRKTLMEVAQLRLGLQSKQGNRAEV